jgi:MFS family permease
MASDYSSSLSGISGIATALRPRKEGISGASALWGLFAGSAGFLFIFLMYTGQHWQEILHWRFGWKLVALLALSFVAAVYVLLYRSLRRKPLLLWERAYSKAAKELRRTALPQLIVDSEVWAAIFAVSPVNVLSMLVPRKCETARDCLLYGACYSWALRQALLHIGAVTEEALSTGHNYVKMYRNGRSLPDVETSARLAAICDFFSSDQKEFV